MLLLFKGIAKYIIDNNKINQEFIDDYSFNYSSFKQDINGTEWSQIESATGLKKADIEVVGEAYANSENSIFAWGMGITHHQHGVENVEYIANLALLRGMIGRPHAGLLPLRGHSNVQGIGTNGVKPVLGARGHPAYGDTELGVNLVEP